MTPVIGASWQPFPAPRVPRLSPDGARNPSRLQGDLHRVLRCRVSRGDLRGGGFGGSGAGTGGGEGGPQGGFDGGVHGGVGGGQRKNDQKQLHKENNFFA